MVVTVYIIVHMKGTKNMSDDKGYYVGGSLTLGAPPVGGVGVSTMTKSMILGDWANHNGVYDTLEKTGHNEYSFMVYRISYVKYRETVIVEMDQNGRLEICTGGWNTTSTRRHIQKALRRMGHGNAVVSGQKDIRGINVVLPNFTDGRGVFKGGVGGVFTSDLGYTQDLPTKETA